MVKQLSNDSENDTDGRPDEVPDDVDTTGIFDRSKDYSTKKKYKKDLAELYKDVCQGYADKKEQIEAIERYWRVYNCELTTNQAYEGISQVYLPIVHDAVEACVTRYVNMLFPESGRYTDVYCNDGGNIHALVGLLDHYVKRDRLRDKARVLLRNGEVEGQMSVYVDWQVTERFVTKKIEKHPEIEPGIHDPTDTFMDAEDDAVTDERPHTKIISAADLVVLPATAEDIEVDAEVVAIRHFLTKHGIDDGIKDGLFEEEPAKRLKDLVQTDDPNQIQDPKREQAASAGVKMQAGKKIVCIFEVWKKFKIEGKTRWCRIYFGGENIVLGFKVNPFWNDRCPVISTPRQKLDGSFWGKSRIDSVEQLQYQANDWVNMAGDSGQYSLFPVVMTDPEKNPNYATMIMNLAAVWQTNPNDTKFVELPQLWKDALQYVAAAESQILKAFSLNPAMIAQGTTARKQSQAAVAQEQQIAVLTTADEVITLENNIFTPWLQRAFELDQQFRDRDLAIMIYGQLGIAAKMEDVPPFAWDDRYEFSWRGSEVMRSAQQNQQMIAGLNILKSLPNPLPSGKRIDVEPIIEVVVNNIYGPRLGARVLVDMRDQMTVDPELENQLIAGMVQVLVHPQDNDVEHLQSHLKAMQETGDPHGLLRPHIEQHQAAMAKKMQAMQPPKGLPGAPGQPGAAGTPRPGAQPGMPRGGQNPPGAIHQDRMQDPGAMPRAAG